MIFVLIGIGIEFLFCKRNLFGNFKKKRVKERKEKSKKLQRKKEKKKIIIRKRIIFIFLKKLITN